MCGRFSQSKSVQTYAKALDSAWEPDSLDCHPTWNMAPGTKGIVFHETDSGRTASLMNWGFLPGWADPTKGQKPINARVETAASKPYFRKAWKSGRCLIPADGWYEWIAGVRVKQPYFIHSADNQPILMAGLYDFNPHANLTTYAILTTDADNSLREVHDRKPVVLSPEAGKTWINLDLNDAEIQAVVQNEIKADGFSWHAVSTKVNNARNDGADLVQTI